MTEQDLTDLDPALDAFLEGFSSAFVSSRTFAHFRAYTRGLLSDAPRKTAEPLALQAGIPARTLQEFLKDHVWDHARLLSLLQPRVVLDSSLHDDGLGLVGIIDETSVVKKGDKTPGVQRQYLGCVGKVENGIVTVHLGLACGRYKTLIDADLFLPKSWSDDRKRCRAAGIPDDVVYRAKWRIALEQLDRAKANSVCPAWLTFDEGYGSCPGFLAGLDERGQTFVGEVPRTLSCLAAVRSGRRPDEQSKTKSAEDVVCSSPVFLSQPWKIVALERETLEDHAWRVKEAAVWTHSAEGWSSGTRRLVWACSEETGEEKFFLSNAPAEIPLEKLLRVAFKRWNVEHGFRVCKSELGFSHFEGQNQAALQRHMTICLLAMAFAAGQGQRLRGKKPRSDDGASMSGAGGAERGMAPETARNGGEEPRTGSVGVPTAAQRRRQAVEEKKGRHHKDTQEAQTETTASQEWETINGSLKVAL